ncbi:MAG: hypothetical protein, partial [Olavius algarvensis Gamma 1 endosymbiont]
CRRDACATRERACAEHSEGIGERGSNRFPLKTYPPSSVR